MRQSVLLSFRPLALATGLCLLALGHLPRVDVQAAAPLETFEATAINLSNIGPTGPVQIQIGIERWSSEAERDRLITTLVERGPDALLNTLQDLPRAGFIRTTTSIGWDLHYAHQRSTGDGRQVVFATDRPMSFWEAANQPRSAQYEFMLADLRLDRRGEGEGKLAVAARITANRQDRSIEIENYGTQPVQLTNVRSSER